MALNKQSSFQIHFFCVSFLRFFDKQTNKCFFLLEIHYSCVSYLRFLNKKYFWFCRRLSLVKGRWWQWVPNCPISRIVAFVEKVSNLGPNRALVGREAGGTRETAASQTGFTLLLYLLLHPPALPPKPHSVVCTKHRTVATVEKVSVEKIGHTASPLSPPSQIRPMKKCIERMKGGKLSTSGSLRCRPGQAITIIECLRLSKLVGIRKGWIQVYNL